MGLVEDFPFSTMVEDEVRIAMKDGVRLVARIWRPVDSNSDPVPAIFEFLPYRRRDGTPERDALTHPYFAGHGYAAVRVDMRGSGDSEGVLRGEYLPSEQDDAITVLEWLEAQPWCTGKVGMIGISWGGFNGLQVAARRPPQLKAVISIASTDDRYADDIHSMGGALLLDKMVWYSTMFSLNAAPPDPAIVGDDWRRLWNLRVAESGFWGEQWLRHQRRDEFHRHGSVCENYAAIETPVFLVGGWTDGYTNSIGRLLDNLACPRKALIGPWAHKYPHFAKPGPQVGFLQECLRWWDYWLKGQDTGIMDEPVLRAWIEDPARPAPYNAEKPGRWVAEDGWPGTGAPPLTLALAPNQLGVAGHGTVSVSSPQNTGMAAGKWCPYGVWADQPLDQRREMGGQIVFDTAPLGEDLDVLGTPELSLTLSCDKPSALVAATLCEVFPDGAATRVSYGILNLTHRNSHAEPEALVPGQRYSVKVRLCDLGHRFGKGNRIRLALSNAYWPIVWPSPEANTVTVYCEASSLTLPERAPRAGDAGLKPLPPAAWAAPLRQSELEPSFNTWTESFDAMNGIATLQRINEGGLWRIEDIVLDCGVRAEQVYTIDPNDPLSARLRTVTLRRYRRGGWDVAVTTELDLTASKTMFHLKGRMELREGGRLVNTQEHTADIPRDHV